MRAIFLAASLTLLAGAALAQEDLRIDRSKIHVNDPAACDLLEAKGYDAFMELDFLALDFSEGIESMEFQCSFFDVETRKGSTHLFINAVCELPGEIYPDILAITAYSEREIQVASSADIAWARQFDPAEAQSEGAMVPTGTTIYTRCDNLSEITVD